MAYVTRNNDSGTVRIPECKGLLQYGDSVAWIRAMRRTAAMP